MHHQNKGVHMVAFVLCSLSLMALGWFGLRVSVVADIEARRLVRTRWYDVISMVLMLGGALCSVGGLVVLAWRFLP